jgi:hypothetical protein
MTVEEVVTNIQSHLGTEQLTGIPSVIVPLEIILDVCKTCSPA